MAIERERAIAFLEIARKQDEKQNWQAALEAYEKCIDLLLRSQRSEPTDSVKRVVQKQIVELLERAEFVKATISARKPTPSSADSSSEDDHNSDKSENAQLRSRIMDAVVTNKLNVQWSDIAGLESVKNSLKQAVVYPLKMKHLFADRLEAWTGILMFGPPGTGKTMLAKAVATEAKVNMFFQVSASKIMGKWVGDSERTVAMLFKVARENAPSVIFCDEVDALCSSRSSREHEVSRKVKTTFLEEMDGCGAQNSGVLILAATNVPWELDDAFMRRFQKKIYIPPPTTDGLEGILQVHLKKIPNSLSKSDYKEIAARCSGFTGSDIHTLVRTARNHALTTLPDATHFRYIKCPDNYKHLEPSAAAAADEDEIVFAAQTMFPSFPLHARSGANKMLEPCSPGHDGAFEMDFKEVCDRDWFHKIHLPPVSVMDFRHALSIVKRSPLSRPLEQYEQFTESFGEHGGGSGDSK